ncbi:MAG: hypothetical protein ISS36_03275 [Candidatus Aenigmarchaeota archaeon]|nr:hypothetical protein [Candidatus Aenigmarchaeota archaeon]
MEAILAGVAVLAIPVLAEYAKLRVKAEKAFNLIAGAGIMSVLSANMIGLNTISGTEAVVSSGSMLFSVISWILLLVGALWATYKLTMK